MGPAPVFLPQFSRVAFVAMALSNSDVAVDMADDMRAAQLKAPDTRPPLLSTAPPVRGEPHLGDVHTGRVAVPADGLCLYYCIVASEDLAGWLDTHGNGGMATTPEMVSNDIIRAKELRQGLIEYLKNKEMDLLRIDWP